MGHPLTEGWLSVQATPLNVMPNPLNIHPNRIIAKPNRLIAESNRLCAYANRLIPNWSRHCAVTRRRCHHANTLRAQARALFDSPTPSLQIPFPCEAFSSDMEKVLWDNGIPRESAPNWHPIIIHVREGSISRLRASLIGCSFFRLVPFFFGPNHFALPTL